MTDVASSTIKLDKTLRINHVMKLNQLAKDYNGSIFLKHDSRSVNLKHLTKAVSFLLTVGVQEQFEVLIKGANAVYILEQIDSVFKTSRNGEASELFPLLQPTKKFKI